MGCFVFVKMCVEINNNLVFILFFIKEKCFVRNLWGFVKMNRMFVGKIIFFR